MNKNQVILPPNWLKRIYRFWSKPIPACNETRSSFNLLHYKKVCEARGLVCDIEIIE